MAEGGGRVFSLVQPRAGIKIGSWSEKMGRDDGAVPDRSAAATGNRIGPGREETKRMLGQAMSEWCSVCVFVVSNVSKPLFACSLSTDLEPAQRLVDETETRDGTTKAACLTTVWWTNESEVPFSSISFSLVW